MKTYYEFLNEDFSQGIDNFMWNYVYSISDKKFTKVEDIFKTKLWRIVHDDPYLYYEEINNIFEYDFATEVDLESENYDEFVENEEEYKQHIEEFCQFVISDLKQRVENVESRIKKYINLNGLLTIYRAIAVGDNYIEHLETQGKHVGIYWTMDTIGADVYERPDIRHPDYDYKMTIIMTSQVHEDHVNWDDTLRLQLHAGIGETELEIRLFKGTPLRILNIEEQHDGNDLDISSIESKTFYA